MHRGILMLCVIYLRLASSYLWVSKKGETSFDSGWELKKQAMTLMAMTCKKSIIWLGDWGEIVVQHHTLLDNAFMWWYALSKFKVITTTWMHSSTSDIPCITVLVHFFCFANTFVWVGSNNCNIVTFVCIYSQETFSLPYMSLLLELPIHLLSTEKIL